MSSIYLFLNIYQKFFAYLQYSQYFLLEIEHFVFILFVPNQKVLASRRHWVRRVEVRFRERAFIVLIFRSVEQMGKVPFFNSLNPKNAGSLARGMGRKLSESITLRFKPLWLMDISFEPLGIMFGAHPWAKSYSMINWPSNLKNNNKNIMK